MYNLESGGFGVRTIVRHMKVQGHRGLFRQGQSLTRWWPERVTPHRQYVRSWGLALSATITQEDSPSTT